MVDIVALVDAVIPDIVSDALVVIASRTGLAYGVMTQQQYWYQSPKMHIAQFIFMMCVCVALHRASRGFRATAIAKLSAKGVGWSMKCPINTLIAYTLLGCFATQVYTKAIRPKPLIQLGWLLMPCHLCTLAWVYVLLRQKPTQYGGCCYVASLLVDWIWGPVLAVAAPDWGDHQFRFEGYIFVLHHTLLLLVPFYVAARYHTLALSWAHLWHLTWVPIFLHFAIFTPYAMLTGLNSNYMMYPPSLGLRSPAWLSAQYYRVICVLYFVALSVASNVIVRGIAKGVVKACVLFKKAERKIKK